MLQAPSSSEPADVDPAVADGLRREVGWLRRVERRRVFPVRLHLGRPGSPRSIGSDPLGWLSGPPWPVPGWVDAGARRDLAAELAATWAEQQGAEPAWCWLSRPGRPQTHDEDPAWSSAMTWATDACAVPLLGFRVVTRYGWFDLDTGQGRLWKRLRLVRSP